MVLPVLFSHLSMGENIDLSRYIVCQSWTGGPVPQPLLKRLFFIARYMLRMGDRSASLAAGDCDGRLETQMQRTTVGGFTGIRFHAVIEFESYTRDVWFMLRDSEEALNGLEDALGINLGPTHGFSPEEVFPEFRKPSDQDT